VIGDAILFYLADQSFNIVGRPPVANWVQYHVETGKYNATVERDERSAQNQGRRKAFRFQIQGPNALKVMEAVTGGAVPDIKFFHMDVFPIAGLKVRALRHGMVGQPGWELWGPWDQGDQVREALLQAGKAFGIRQVGARTYPTSTIESGWIPSPLPAVYTGDDMKPYREWLKATSYEAMASLGGSFMSGNIEDYYLTPHELGYGPIVKFDHDFVGRAALEAMPAPRRQKVTFVWNGDDVARALGTLFHAGANAKYIDSAARQLRDAAVRQSREGRQGPWGSPPTRPTRSTSARCCRSAASTWRPARTAAR
jgi:vanillate/3-O-methylgallate O-demethylase